MAADEKSKAEQYARWIVDNQDKKGTEEFKTVAAAYQRARDQEQQAPASTAQDPSGPTPSERQQNTTSDVLSGFQSSALRLGSNVLQLGEQVGDILTYDNPLELDIPGVGQTREQEAEALERKRASQGLLGRFSDSLDTVADKIGRYEGETSAGDVIDSVKEGDFIGAAGDALRVGVGNAVASAPEFLPYLHPVTAAVQGIQNVGDTAEARALNDGRTEADLGDMAVALPAEAANTVLSRLGMRVPVGKGLSGIGQRSALEGITGQAQGQISDAAQTVGTETGFDLDRNIERGLQDNLTGLAAGQLVKSPVAVGSALNRRADNRRMADVDGKLSPERLRMIQIEQKASQDIMNHMDSLTAQGHRVTLEQDGTKSARTLARQAGREYRKALKDLKKVGRIKRGPLTDDEGFSQTLESHFEQLVQAGADAQNMQALPLDDHIQAIDAIDAPDSVKQSLRDQVNYIQSLANAGVKIRQRSGPIANVMGTYGGIIGHAMGFEAGSGRGKTPSFAAATAGSSALGDFGRAVGGRMDAFLGQSAPDITRDHDVRTRILAREGLDAADISLPQQMQPFSQQARRRDRTDAIEELRAMRDNPETSNVFGSTRLKTMQEYKQLQAGEQLAALEDLVMRKVIPAPLAKELFEMDPDTTMDRDVFRVLERAIAEEAYSKRRGGEGLSDKRAKALRKRIDELVDLKELSSE